MSDTINNPNQNTNNNIENNEFLSNINPDELETDIIPDQNQSIESILNTELNVENINNYAEDAFEKLVAFAEQKVEDYKKLSATDNLSSNKQVEDAAFEYYGVEDIPSILDYIINENNKIRNLDNIIAKSKKIDSVVVETDNSNRNILTGDGESFKEKKLLNRLKTVLYILEKKYQVDVNSEDQLKITEGDIRDNMMRRTSYFMLEIAQLDRTVLVCDEEGNASYIFNSDALTKKEISNDYLIGLTKPELNELIKNTPEFGRRVVYSKNGFVPRIIDSIDNPNSVFVDEVKPELLDSGRLLIEKAPEGCKPIYGIATELGVDSSVIKKTIDKIKSSDNYHGELEASDYRFGQLTVRGYSLEQQELIKDYLDEELPPEGYKSANNIANELGVGYLTVTKAIDYIKSTENYYGELESRLYKFHTSVAQGYSPEQQEIIKSYLNTFLDKAPEGYKSVSVLSDELSVSYGKIKKIIDYIKSSDNYHGELEASDYRFGKIRTEGYSPEQQEIIKEYLDKESLPEGYRSITTMVKELRAGYGTIKRAMDEIKSLGDYKGELEANNYRFGQMSAEGYSPEQQEIIKEYLNRKGNHA